MQPPIRHRGCMLSLHFPEGCEFFRGIAAMRDNGKDVSPSWALALPLFRLLLARMLFPYRESVRTITTDNGCEFAAHLEITRLLSIKGRDKVIVYFADSYCSWQKGAIENANKLIRKYIPKKSNFDDFSDSKIMRIQKKLNARPREKLNFDSPKNCFFNHFY